MLPRLPLEHGVSFAVTVPVICYRAITAGVLLARWRRSGVLTSHFKVTTIAGASASGGRWLEGVVNNFVSGLILCRPGGRSSAGDSVQISATREWCRAVDRRTRVDDPGRGRREPHSRPPTRSLISGGHKLDTTKDSRAVEGSSRRGRCCARNRGGNSHVAGPAPGDTATTSRHQRAAVAARRLNKLGADRTYRLICMDQRCHDRSGSQSALKDVDCEEVRARSASTSSDGKHLAPLESPRLDHPGHARASGRLLRDAAGTALSLSIASFPASRNAQVSRPFEQYRYVRRQCRRREPVVTKVTNTTAISPKNDREITTGAVDSLSLTS